MAELTCYDGSNQLWGGNLPWSLTSSGNGKRTMTIREAIVDEQDGGSFLADMTDIEFAKYQQLIWQAETPRPKKRARGPSNNHFLTEEQRALLGDFDMDALEEFLCTEHPISDDNRRQVMRQAEKLVSGQGVRYDSPTYGWDEGVVFREGEPVTMSSDIVQIISDARDFEDEHGRDHGNGWLLNHPLRKLLIFQTHVARLEATR